MLFTLVIWVGSAILLLVAAVMCERSLALRFRRSQLTQSIDVPLLCYIQGNLKEYCCHKVDKRCASPPGTRTMHVTDFQGWVGAGSRSS